MRLRDPKDRVLLLAELGRPVNTAGEITEEVFQELVEKRADWRKSKDAKAKWRRNKWKYLKGIKKFHKSTAGKKFHRQLGRYISTRIFKNESITELTSTVDEFLTAISSLRTHLYIDLGYYKSILEEIEYAELVEAVIPVLNEIEIKFLDRRYQELALEELEVLLRLITPDVLEELFEVKVEEDKMDDDLYLSHLVLHK